MTQGMTRAMTQRMMQGIVLLLLVAAPMAAQEHEIPLESCRQLPIVKAKVGKSQFQFLLDTGAATSLLNLKSFSSADATEITMESWNGAVAAKGRKVMLSHFALGEHELENLSLLAVDLTPLERSCQKRVDGVLGADLIARLGLTIDLKNHVGILNGEARSPESRLSELMRQQAACEQAFNHSDEKTFAECLDPDIVLLTSKGDFRGRTSVMKHFKENYFGQDPPVQVSITPRTRRAIGPVVWMEYDISVTLRGQVMKARGTALYQKTGDRWRMSNMNYSVAGK